MALAQSYSFWKATKPQLIIFGRSVGNKKRREKKKKKESGEQNVPGIMPESADFKNTGPGQL